MTFCQGNAIVWQPNMIFCQHKVRVSHPNVRVYQGNVRVCQPYMRVYHPNVRVCQPNVRVCQLNVRVCQPNVRVCQLNVRVCQPNVRAVSVCPPNMALEEQRTGTKKRYRRTRVTHKGETRIQHRGSVGECGLLFGLEIFRCCLLCPAEDGCCDCASCSGTLHP